MVGDTVYGAPRQERVVRSCCRRLSESFLHSARLGFRASADGKLVEFARRCPRNWSDYLHTLGKATGTNPSRLTLH